MCVRLPPLANTKYVEELKPDHAGGEGEFARKNGTYPNTR